MRAIGYRLRYLAKVLAPLLLYTFLREKVIYFVEPVMADDYIVVCRVVRLKGKDPMKDV